MFFLKRILVRLPYKILILFLSYAHNFRHGQNGSRRSKNNTATKRNISKYQMTETAPTDAYFQKILTHLLSLAAHKPDALATKRQ
jgi:hypothetical protein